MYLSSSDKNKVYITLVFVFDMKTPIILWSGINGAGDDVNYEEPEHCIEVWQERRKLLQSKGLDLKMLVPKRSIRFYGPEMPVIEYLDYTSPDMLVGCPGEREEGFEEEYDQRVNWPRDTFKFLGSKVFASEADVENSRTLLTKLNTPYEVYPSRIGEGGFSIGFDHTLIFSEGKSLPINEDDRQKARDLGYRVYSMPVANSLKPGFGYKEKCLWSRMGQNGHIDTELNVVEKRPGENLLLVNSEYYEVFQAETERLAGQIGAKIHVIDNRAEIMYKAVNFITLPNGEVIISRENEGVIRFLSDELGKDRVNAIETFRRECTVDYGGGGLRCRTNIIY